MQREKEKSTRDEPTSRGEQVGLLGDNDSSDKSDPELAVELGKGAGKKETNIVGTVPEAERMGKDIKNQGERKCKAVTRGIGPCHNNARQGYQTCNIKRHCEQDPSVSQDLPLKPEDPPNQQALLPSPYSTRSVPSILVTPPQQVQSSSPTPTLAPIMPTITPTLTPTSPPTTSQTDRLSASLRELDRTPETSVATIRQELRPKSDRSPETSIRQEMLQKLDRSLETSLTSIRRELLQKLDRSPETSVAIIRQEIRDGDEKLSSQIANATERMGSLQDVVDQLPGQMELLFVDNQVMDAMRGRVDVLQQDTNKLRQELVKNAAQQGRAINDIRTANDNALAQLRQDVTPEVWGILTKIVSSSTHEIQTTLDTQGKRTREFAERYRQNKMQVQGELQALGSKVDGESKAIQSLSERVRRSEALEKSLSQKIDELNTATPGSKPNWEHTQSSIPPQARLSSNASSQSRFSSQHLPSSLQRDESFGLARNEGADQENVKRQADVVERLKSQLLNDYGEDEEKLARDLENLPD